MSSPVSYLDPVQLQRDLGLRDLSDPAEGPHAIQVLIGQAVEAAMPGLGLRGPLVPRSPGRAGRRQLRPARLPARSDHQGHSLHPVRRRREHAAEPFQRHDPPRYADWLPAARADDVLLVCPGMVYRRDSIDWQHTGDPPPTRPVVDHPAAR